MNNLKFSSDDSDSLQFNNQSFEEIKQASQQLIEPFKVRLQELTELLKNSSLSSEEKFNLRLEKRMLETSLNS
jgi:DNA anti-recombination protein RmuC